MFMKNTSKYFTHYSLFHCRLTASTTRLNEELTQLKEMLEERNGTVKRIEEEKENLEVR